MPCRTCWGCATFASKSTTFRRLSTGWPRTAMAWSAVSASTKTCGAWPTYAGRRESSWPWPSESTDDHAVGRNRRAPIRRGLGAVPTQALSSRESELGWAIDELQGGGLWRTGRFRSINMNDTSASQQIDAIIAKTAGWKGERLGQLRALVRDADPGVIEEVKWKKPSRPEGVPVWSRDGIVCIGETLKNAVRLTFPKGAQLKDPKGLFNTRLDSKSVRAIDFHEGDVVNASALKALIVQGARLNRG